MLELIEVVHVVERDVLGEVWKSAEDRGHGTLYFPCKILEFGFVFASGLHCRWIDWGWWWWNGEGVAVKSIFDQNPNPVILRTFNVTDCFIRFLQGRIGSKNDPCTRRLPDIRVLSALRSEHLVLWYFKIAVEFPPYSAILIASAIREHSNTSIQEGETRKTVPQYNSAGLFRWVAYGFIPKWLAKLRGVKPAPWRANPMHTFSKIYKYTLQFTL